MTVNHDELSLCVLNFDTAVFYTIKLNNNQGPSMINLSLRKALFSSRGKLKTNKPRSSLYMSHGVLNIPFCSLVTLERGAALIKQ